MKIPSFDIKDNSEEIIGSLSDAGCVVVTGMTDETTRTKVCDELAPYMKSSPVRKDNPQDFYPGNTRRMSALVALSETVGELVTDQKSLDICDHFLLPNSE
ncbi:MAG TPA: hypothetical protein QF379_01670, partial [SAR86 cluster bacterium]|nr:hypothetical protein [SAR86 cluster bacterium]